MILSDEGIRRALQQGDVSIDPIPSDDQYTTSAVDLFVGRADTFFVWDERPFAPPGTQVYLNLALHDYQRTAKGYRAPATVETDGTVVIPPRGFVVALTRERIGLKRDAQIPLAARVEGRSSLARVGLVVHLTAPIIHAGFDAQIALEMVNFGPFFLKVVPEKTRICQLVLERLDSPPGGPITTQFQHQTRP